MKLSERQVIADKICHFFDNEAKGDRRQRKQETVAFFKRLNESQSTVYRIINRYEKTGSSAFAVRIGKRPTVATAKNLRLVKQKLANKITSVRKAAHSLGIAKSTLQDMKKKLNMKTQKRKVTPEYTLGQMKRAKTNCRKLYDSVGAKIFVLDDETYVPANPAHSSGQQYFNFIDKSKVPDKVRFRGKPKFAKKFLVWQAIDEDGNVSKPFVVNHSLKSNEYLEECLQKRLLPFIREHHQTSQVLFWPDLATIHYSKQVIEWLQNNGIPFVSKVDNPPNVPHARPIEKFWSLCKVEYMKKTKVTKNVGEMSRWWQNMSQRVGSIHGNSLMNSTRRMVRQIGRGGVFEPFKK